MTAALPAMFLAAVPSAWAAYPHATHLKAACDGLLDLETCPHSGHSREVLRGSTNSTVTPARLALYSTNKRSCPNDQPESRARCRRLALLTRKRMPVKSSRAIACFVRSAISTISLLIMWLVLVANLFSLPESLLRRRLEEYVRFLWSFLLASDGGA